MSKNIEINMATDNAGNYEILYPKCNLVNVEGKLSLYSNTSGELSASRLSETISFFKDNQIIRTYLGERTGTGTVNAYTISFPSIFSKIIIFFPNRTSLGQFYRSNSANPYQVRPSKGDNYPIIMINDGYNTTNTLNFWNATSGTTAEMNGIANIQFNYNFSESILTITPNQGDFVASDIYNYNNRLYRYMAIGC